MLGLQLDQLTPQLVELAVRDNGGVERVVAELVVGNLGGELGVPVARTVGV